MFGRGRRATTPPKGLPDPLQGRADDDVLGFAELSAIGVQPREAIRMVQEQVLEVRDRPDRPGRGCTVASVRAYLATRVHPQEERITLHVTTPPGEVR